MIKNVLIVDDDQEMLASLQNGMAKYKDTFTLLTAGDGKDALAQLQNHTISLVVTDLKMPRMDGFALLQHVMENYPDIPVIVITGYSTPEMERLAREGGAVGYIAKPFLLDNLARKIMAALRQESEGGTLHSVSSGIFLQLMEMEQKTCTIRLEDKLTGSKGVLFFKDGELLDARVNSLQGKQAAYKIFSWDKVTISIQNVCPPIENRIKCDLQPLILEASRLKDEAEMEPSQEQESPQPPETESERTSPSFSPSDFREKIEKQIGPRCGLEDIYQDRSWAGMLHQLSQAGTSFGFGRFRLCYVDKGEPFDNIVLADGNDTVLAVSPKCPREKLIKALNF